MTRETTLHDVQNNNQLRILEHDGYVYFETLAKHAGTTIVASSLRVDRDIAMLALRKLVLT